MFGGGEEIGESVALSLHPAGVVPWFAEFSAAADVRQRVDDSATKQAETIGIEIDGDGDDVAAIPVQEQGSGAVARGFPVINQGERHASAVGGTRMQAFDDVFGRIITAENRQLLPKGPFAGMDVVVENGPRRNEGFILKANVRSVEFRIFTDRRV